jgi:hypothetical protein
MAVREHANEESQEIEILLILWQAKWIDCESGRVRSDFDVGSAKEAREVFEAAAEIEYESVWAVFLQIGNKKVQ